MQLCFQYFTTGRNPGHGSEFCYRDDTAHIQYNSYTTTDHAYSVCLSVYMNAIAFINKVKLFFLSRPTKKTVQSRMIMHCLWYVNFRGFRGCFKPQNLDARKSINICHCQQYFIYNLDTT